MKAEDLKKLKLTYFLEGAAYAATLAAYWYYKSVLALIAGVVVIGLIEWRAFTIERDYGAIEVRRKSKDRDMLLNLIQVILLIIAKDQWICIPIAIAVTAWFFILRIRDYKRLPAEG